jgi:hypothetical protein
VLADDQALDRGRMNAELGRDVDAEAQGVDRGSRAEHAVVSRERAGQIRQRIGRIRDRDEHGVGRHGDDTRDDVSVHRRIGVEQLQPPARVIAVGRASALSLTPAQISTTSAPARSLQSPPLMATLGDNGPP